eukprot:199860_1
MTDEKQTVDTDSDSPSLSEEPPLDWERLNCQIIHVEVALEHIENGEFAQALLRVEKAKKQSYGGICTDGTLFNLQGDCFSGLSKKAADDMQQKLYICDAIGAYAKAFALSGAKGKNITVKSKLNRKIRELEVKVLFPSADDSISSIE